MRTLRIALALLLIVPAALRAQAVNVVIFPLSGLDLTSDRGEAMAAALRDMLITEFAQNAKMKMVERGSIDELLKSRNLSLSGKLKDEDAVQVGQLLGAQYAVAGGLIADAKEARLDLRLIDIESGAIANTYKDKAPKDNLLSLVDDVAAKFGDVKLKPRPVDIVVPVASAFAYSRGLDYEKRGEKLKAAEMFESALKLFPDNAAARAALDRVK